MQLTVGSGSLSCPGAPTAVAPIADLSDTGFAPTDRLTVTATLPLTASTSAEQVCFNSTVPFLVSPVQRSRTGFGAAVDMHADHERSRHAYSRAPRLERTWW